mgnify:CR=1 FL=1
MEDENTVSKVVKTFDGLWDNATAAVDGAATTVGTKAVEAAGGVGDFLSENADNVVTFAKGLFGN